MNTEKRIRDDISGELRGTLQSELDNVSNMLVNAQQQALHHEEATKNEITRRENVESARSRITERLYARVQRQNTEMNTLRALLAKIQTAGGSDKSPKQIGGGEDSGDKHLFDLLLKEAMDEAQKSIVAHQLRPQQGRCAICLESEETVVLMPCRHKNLCASCAAMVTSCPICRSHVTERLKVFES
jgi:hypothetical protein